MNNDILDEIDVIVEQKFGKSDLEQLISERKTYVIMLVSLYIMAIVLRYLDNYVLLYNLATVFLPVIYIVLSILQIKHANYYRKKVRNSKASFFIRLFYFNWILAFVLVIFVDIQMPLGTGFPRGGIADITAYYIYGAFLTFFPSIISWLFVYLNHTNIKAVKSKL